MAANGGSMSVAGFRISWSGDSAAGTLRGTVTMTADWDPYTYNITWNGNGGSGHAPTSTNSVEPTTALTVPSNPTRAGYSFKGSEHRQ